MGGKAQEQTRCEGEKGEGVKRRESIIELLRRTGSFVDSPAKRGRGRPKLRTLLELNRSMGATIAMEVFREEFQQGCGRGAFMAAVRIVASRRRMPVDSVKRSATRYRTAVRWQAKFESEIGAYSAEIDRRMMGFPADVHEWVGVKLSTAGLMTLLRENNIDGTCPKWLIDLARGG